MNVKRATLEQMSRDQLKSLLDQLELDGDRRSASTMRQTLSRSRKATPAILLSVLRETEVKEVCRLSGKPTNGRRKALISSLLNSKDLSAKPTKGTRSMAKTNKPKEVTRYTYDDQTEPRTPETGHTALLPGDDQVVTLPMDNGWSKAINVGKLPDDDTPIVLDMDPAAAPVLFWSGKRNRRKVPVLPLQRNEVVSESRIAQIINRARDAAKNETDRPTQQSLFSELEKSLRESDKAKRVDFYSHDEGWKNKLICGDSLHVMESLLHYEGLRGKVQMIYVDPPYGVQYNSNFQQRVDATTNDPNDRADDVLTVKAFQDTWTLGVHSYLSYLADRLYLCRELMADTGSIFVQISDENVHRVRLLMDEVFGAHGYVSQISFVKTSSQSSDFLSTTFDYLLWYAKERSVTKYFQLYRDKELGSEGSGQYTWLELRDGTRRRMTREERVGEEPLPKDARVLRPDNMCSTRQGRAHEIWPIDFEGREYWPTGASTWKTNKEGAERLKAARRLIAVGNTLCYVRYIDDFKAFPITNTWTDTVVSGFGGDKYYVTQTNPKVVERCMAMTTEPGQLVLDITSGGGTTPFVAESLGRRWVACDISRVAINITRQRMLANVFQNFQQKGERISDGLTYKTLPRITLGSIASDREPGTIELVDQPLPDNSAIRVTGPFEVMSIGRYSVEDWKGYVVGQGGEDQLENYIKVICHLYRKDAAIQGANGFVHAIAETEKEQIAPSVGPLSGRITGRQLHDAVQDALAAGILEVHVLGWAFEANVGEVKAQLESRGKVKVQLFMIRPDTLAEGLKITKPEMLFSPLAMPDITVSIEKNGKSGRQATVTLNGVAIFDRKSRSTDYKHADSGYVAAWYLDEDYDGDCFVDCQMFFDFRKAPKLEPAAGAAVPKNEYQLQLTSQPFPVRSYSRIAVKVVDVYGNESTVVKDLK